MALGSRFVVVGVDTTDSGPAAYTSPTGSTWTEQSVPGTKQLDAVIAGGPRFVSPLSAVESGSDLAVSLDAESWTLDASGQAVGVLGRPGVFGGDTYVSVDGVNSYTSTDGISWTKHSGVLPGSTWYDIAYGGGVFVVVGVSSGGNTIAYSPDGSSWSTVATTTAWLTVAYGAGLFVAHTGNADNEGDAATGVTITSPDGATWTDQNSFDGGWRRSAYNGSRFAAIGYGRASGETPEFFCISMTSADGLNWSFSRQVSLDYSLSSYPKQLAGGGGVFVYAPFTNNEIWRSTDGSSWSSVGTFANRSWRGIAHYQQNRNYGWKVGSL